MITIEDAYNELGLKSTATLQEVRSKYISLARKHHPDKLIGKPPEDIAENEEKFKRITNAYHKINDIGNNIDDSEDWLNKIWIFFKDPELWESVKDIINKISKKENKHIITVPVTLEEVHNKRLKKLRLFLKNMKEPIFCDIDCSKYPGYLNIHNGIQIQYYMKLKEHNIYRNDDLINMWDLYVTINISWYEFINGLEIDIKYLDNSELKVIIPEFPDFNKTIIEKGKGLCGRGDLYICYELVNITKNKWNLIEDNKKNIIMDALKSLG